MLGNRIGTDALGAVALGNTSDGVSIEGAPSNTVGGTTAATRNVLSGNLGDGLSIGQADATGNVILGNFIGTDLAGTVPLGNGDDGIQILGAPGNTVGGTVLGAGNVISANGSNGIFVLSAGATGNVVRGNSIGTDVSGTSDLGNLSNGVNVQGVSGTTIGGSAPGAGNVISRKRG